MTVLYHWSDNHGKFSHLLEYVERNGLPDIFVCTGDLLPNNWAVFSFTKEHEAEWQKKWFMRHGEALKDVVQDRPLLYVLGNHDFAHMQPLLEAHCIDAVQVPSWGVEYSGYKWAGFREIPWIGGFWNRECDDTTLSRITDEVVQANPDILLTHSPPANILDLCHDGDRAGIVPLRNALAGGSMNPRLHLFGHIHECGGRQEEIEGTLFVNSATTIQRILLD